MKFYGELGCGLETNWLHFGDHLHHCPDPGVHSGSRSGSRKNCHNSVLLAFGGGLCSLSTFSSFCVCVLNMGLTGVSLLSITCYINWWFVYLLTDLLTYLASYLTIRWYYTVAVVDIKCETSITPSQLVTVAVVPSTAVCHVPYAYHSCYWTSLQWRWITCCLVLWDPGMLLIDSFRFKGTQLAKPVGVKISAPSPNFVAMATRVGPEVQWIADLLQADLPCRERDHGVAMW